jgi:fructokinase
MSKAVGVCIFGEVLFDHFPDGSRVLGGAPFNVAWHLQAFGQAPLLVSRVGDDPEGEEVRAAMVDWGMRTDGLQLDRQHPTGRVSVDFVAGEPSYDIVSDCAYDHILPNLVAPCHLLYHGSLAVRSGSSAQALSALRSTAVKTVFMDVNLRPPWYQASQLRTLLHGANWIKLNHEELDLLGAMGDSSAAARTFLQRYDAHGLLVTRGARGAELFLDSGETLHVSPRGDTTVIDTVGAGDAFTSVMLLGILRNWPMPITLERAQQFAAALVGHRGATIAETEFYRAFSRDWRLD